MICSYCECERASEKESAIDTFSARSHLDDFIVSNKFMKAIIINYTLKHTHTHTHIKHGEMFIYFRMNENKNK